MLTSFGILQGVNYKTDGTVHRTFRHDLNQIPFDYTAKVRNGFNRLDLIDREPDELWMEVHDIV